jgi:type I restriction enzyme, S subunit
MSDSTRHDRSIGWEFVPLAEMVEVLDHKRVPVNRKEREHRVGDVPYYGATGQVGWIDNCLFDEDLVLLGEDGVQFHDPLAMKAYVIRGRSWVNNHAHVLRAKEGVLTQYICYALNAADFTDLANGTTRLKLTKSAMLRLRLPLPSVAEQQRVVDTLSWLRCEIDDGVAGFQRALTSLRKYRNACLAAAFGVPTHKLEDVALIQSGIAKGRPHGDDLVSCAVNSL